MGGYRRMIMNRLLASRPFRVIAAVIVGGSLVGGVADALIPAGNTITGCYIQDVGLLRLIDPAEGGRCRRA